MTDEIERIARGLSEAQRDIMRGHLVEIPPEEADELKSLGLKGEEFKQRVVYDRMVWPITPLGLQVRARLGEGA